MPVTEQIHAPQLVNALGHAAGAVLFAIFAFLLSKDRIGSRLDSSRQAIAAALLALVWNAASLAEAAVADDRSLTARVLLGVSSSALSLLPAVLFKLAVGIRLRALVGAGYALGLVAIVMHASEILRPDVLIHRRALTLITVGFGALTVLAAFGLLRSADLARRRLISRLLATMCLFLFAMTFAHLGSEEALHAWPVELAIHHAGIPLALFLLLQDYRSVFLDALIRLLADILLASAFATGALWLVTAGPAPGDEPGTGLLVVALTLAFVLYAVARRRVEAILSRLLFGRSDLRRVLHKLRSRRPALEEDAGYLDWVAHQLAEFMGADTAGPLPQDLCVSLRQCDLVAPVITAGVPECREGLEGFGAEVVIPLRLSRMESSYIVLGRRAGGRRYLSEDLEALGRLAAQISEDAEQFREAELERLVTQSELRALQSQIHPHFLFNALNALYGLIPREASGARRTVMNLADIFRYFLQSEKALVTFEEELRIIRAYLEIESLRLGPRLRTVIAVEPEALQVRIPLLSVQPLVENAVRHGVASRPVGGTVTLEARVLDKVLRIAVRDTGPGFQNSTSPGAGIGLSNVRRRLELCYGAAAELEISSDQGGVSVVFEAPVEVRAEAVR